MAEAWITRRAAGSIRQVEFWPARAKAGAQRLAEALGGEPPAPGASLAAGGWRLWRAGPVTWRLMGAAEGGDGPDPLADLAMEDGAAAEIGPGWSLLEIRGADAPALMARLVALDLREGAFPPGAAATTAHRRAAVTVIRPEDGSGYDMLVPRSRAESFEAAFSAQAARLV